MKKNYSLGTAIGFVFIGAFLLLVPFYWRWLDVMMPGWLIGVLFGVGTLLFVICGLYACMEAFAQ